MMLCDVHGLYVFIYAIYIYSTNRFAGHGKEKVLKLLFENGPLCHSMSLERMLSQVRCFEADIECNNVCHLYNATQCISTKLTWYAVHQQVSPNCPISQ